MGFAESDRTAQSMAALGGKWVQLLKEVAPGIGRVALLYNPNGPTLEFFLPSIQAAASSLDIEVRVATVHARDEIEGVIAAQTRDPGAGVVVMPNAFNTTNRELTSALAARYGVPAIFFASYCAHSGGLIAYGTDYAEKGRPRRRPASKYRARSSPAPTR
jgi:ABC-type uncharacterized transport system substrate-binding protein